MQWDLDMEDKPLIKWYIYPCVCVCVCVLVAQLCLTPCDPMDSSSPFLCPWNSPSKKTGVDCHSLLQEIFLTQGWKPGLLCRRERERERVRAREREWLRFKRVVHMCSKTTFNHPNQLATTACTVLFQYWLTVTQAPGWKYASLIGLYLNKELRFVLCFWHYAK